MTFEEKVLRMIRKNVEQCVNKLSGIDEEECKKLAIKIVKLVNSTIPYCFANKGR